MQTEDPEVFDTSTETLFLTMNFSLPVPVVSRLIMATSMCLILIRTRRKYIFPTMTSFRWYLEIRSYNVLVLGFFLIAAEGSLLFLTMCYSAFEFPAISFIHLKRISNFSCLSAV